MEINNTNLAKLLTATIMGEDYREPNIKQKFTIKILWGRIKKCLFGL